MADASWAGNPDTNPGNDLAYIRRVMEDTERSTAISGAFLVLWGLIDGTGYLTQWWMDRQHATVQRVLLMWAAVLIVGSALAVRQLRRETVYSPIGMMVGLVWTSCWSTICLLYFVGSAAGTFSQDAFPGIEATIIAIPTFFNGLIAKRKWLRNLAFIWWATGVWMLAHPGSHSYLLISALDLALLVVPGTFLVFRTQRWFKPA